MKREQKQLSRVLLNLKQLLLIKKKTMYRLNK